MNEKYDVETAAETMMAVVTTGNGGYDKLDYREVPKPVIAAGEVLVNVLAAGVNNTEINTRLGWYSESVSTGTEETAIAESNAGSDGAKSVKSDGGWNEATPFPFIQGTDCCGRVVQTFPGDDPSLIGSRVIVRACMRKSGFQSMENIWMASDFDGAFAQYVKVPRTEVFPVHCDWSDAELATIPCAYGTAENMVHRSGVSASDTVLVPGASGGVGSAVVQLAKRRGAKVIAISGTDKMGRVRETGADEVIARGTDMISALGEKSVDVVIDNVAGSNFGSLLKVLTRGGRYASSGAIAGPLVALDMRDFYLKDITMYGCTAWDEPVFPSLISYIERGEIKPLVEKVFPLENIADAQRQFLRKKHVGNFVLEPPAIA
jgi:NADPH:quinone reductase-like Zn-dependent oxidoreductase